jgi:endoglucanase
MAMPLKVSRAVLGGETNLIDDWGRAHPAHHSRSVTPSSYRRSIMGRLRIRHTPILVLFGLVVLAGCGERGSSTPSSDRPLAVGFLHTAGGNLVDVNGQEVHLSGVNWFGFETQTFAPHGLDMRNWQSMLDQMVQSGFNTIRLPYSNQLFDSGSAPTEIDYNLNPDLKGLRGLALMDKIIHGAGQRGLKVILDQHRPDAYAQSDLWYTDQVPESRWIADWVMLAKHYAGNSTVIGADLHNEPHGLATWGDGNPRTDWHLAAARAGNAVLAANPDWLIIVEGIENYQGDFYWWGGNLKGAKQYPILLSQPNRLVYSAHDYGPQVWPQTWFQPPTFPQGLSTVWNTHWAYLQSQGIAPVLLGEFGGRSMGQDTEGVWQRSLVDFLKSRSINYTYWSWNPDSGDTGGILEPDWKTVDQTKLHILSAYQWPMMGQRSADIQHTYSQP